MLIKSLRLEWVLVASTAPPRACVAASPVGKPPHPTPRQRSSTSRASCPDNPSIDALSRQVKLYPMNLMLHGGKAEWVGDEGGPHRPPVGASRTCAAEPLDDLGQHSKPVFARKATLFSRTERLPIV
jgi:hypothetical protein